MEIHKSMKQTLRIKIKRSFWNHIPLIFFVYIVSYSLCYMSKDADERMKEILKNELEANEKLVKEDVHKTKIIKQ